ncbi:FAD-dependent oxidoreductase [Candidatus Uhrbacteria bacterium]|nr:FAD-dependent oxidoreductase [Candidatus Uhrbacteria bacterium]
MVKVFDTIIIGGGAAGLSAAIYSGRYLMKTAVIMGHEPGGETATAWTIENYPGIKKIDGFDLVQTMVEQVREAGAELVNEQVREVSQDGHCFTVHTDSDAFQAKTLILATGNQRRHLSLPNEKELLGRGVSYCATCDAPLYKGKDLLIVGGGDSSVKGAILAAGYARKTYLMTQNEKITGEPVNLAKLKKFGSSVEVIVKNQVQELLAKNGKLEGVRLGNKFLGSDVLRVQGVLVEIGFEPKTDFAEMLQCKLDKKGYIEVDSLMRTSVDGVYACGDSTNIFGGFKQVVTAAASGAVAATSVYQDLGIHSEAACRVHALPLLFEKVKALTKR